MKLLCICSLLFLLCCPRAAIAQSRAQPGYKIENPVPPIEVGPAKVDPKKLKADADMLAQLAQSVPSDIDKTTNGMLPKDLPEKLKQIEKLAKRLRGEVSAQLTTR